jgi:hypothetical protein
MFCTSSKSDSHVTLRATKGNSHVILGKGLPDALTPSAEGALQRPSLSRGKRGQVPFFGPHLIRYAQYMTGSRRASGVAQTYGLFAFVCGSSIWQLPFRRRLKSVFAGRPEWRCGAPTGRRGLSEHRSVVARSWSSGSAALLPNKAQKPLTLNRRSALQRSLILYCMRVYPGPLPGTRFPSGLNPSVSVSFRDGDTPQSGVGCGRCG